MSNENYNLANHYVYFPGWLYRAFRRNMIPASVLPRETAIGLCWYEISTGPRIKRRGKRLCMYCAEKATEIFPACVISKYLDTKVRSNESAMTLGLSREDHYCQLCRCTLYAVRDASLDEYDNLDDYLREVCVPSVEVAVASQENDSGIEV